MAARFGAALEPWWDRLPGLLDELAERWDLALGELVGRGNTSLVVRCRRADGSAAVLKLTPETDLGAVEAAALGAWASSGRVPLVWGHDPESGALLLEAIPGEAPIADSNAPVELGRIAGLIGELHRQGEPAVEAVAPLAARVEFIFSHWIGRNSASGEAVAGDALVRGHALAARLVAVGERPVLLHGDLHPGNVLDGGHERGLVAIDPRPCLGDPAFDAVDWVFWSTGPGEWRPRSSRLATELGLDRDRLWTWCVALAPVLAAAAVARGSAAESVNPLLAISP